MVSKCANPACSATLLYLREGKIFRLSGNQRSRQDRDEHFWLCGPCSEIVDLVWDEAHGVRVIQKPQRGGQPAA